MLHETIGYGFSQREGAPRRRSDSSLIFGRKNHFLLILRKRRFPPPEICYNDGDMDMENPSTGMDGKAGKALVVEDSEAEAALARVALERVGFEVEVAEDGTKGLGLILAFDYALAVVDLQLPGVNGLDLIREARERGRDTPVVVLSALGGDDSILGGYGLGIEEYISKGCSLEVLVARLGAIRRRLERGKVCDLVTVWDTTLDRRSKIVVRRGHRIYLPPAKFALLELLMSSKGEVVTYERIYAEVYGGGGSKHAANQAVLELRRDLRVDGVEFVVKNTRGVGYALQ